MRATPFFVTLACLALGGACTRKVPSPEVERLSAKLHELTREGTKLEAKIRDARNDPGLQRQLSAERELVRSRAERVNEQLRQKGVRPGGTEKPE